MKKTLLVIALLMFTCGAFSQQAPIMGSQVVAGATSDGVPARILVNSDGEVVVTGGTGTIDASSLALEAGGNLAAIKAKTDNIPALGQALAAASVPVILPSATITTLTPPAAITGFALETGGNLAGAATSLAALDNGISGNFFQQNLQQVLGSTHSATNPIFVRQVNTAGAAPDDSAIDSAINSGENPVYVGGIFESTPTVIENGDKGATHFDANQALLTANMYDPCLNSAKTTLAISQADDAQLIAASGSTKIYVCSGALIAGAAEIVNLISGTGTVCGTGTTAIAGSTTQGNGLSLAANGGFIIPSIQTNVAGDALCLTQNTTSRVSGWITYVQK